MELRLIGLQPKRWHGKVARRAFTTAASAGADGAPAADVMIEFDASPGAGPRVHLQQVPVHDHADVALATIVLATAEWHTVDQALPHPISQLRNAWPQLLETVLAAQARGEPTALGARTRRTIP